MIGTFVTVFLGLAGLAFGSFLNACVSRWPKNESVVKPRSHCRACGRALTWWENIPLISWLALRGRCRTCKQPIGWRYPLVELAVGVLWAFTGWQVFRMAPELNYGEFSSGACLALAQGLARLIFLWILVALAVLDVENLWLPDRLILPGIGLGIVLCLARVTIDTAYHSHGSFGAWRHLAATAAVHWLIGAVVPAAAVLIVRFIYFRLRGQEGIGMGDVKLIAMLGGWLGIERALLSLALGVVTGAIVALLLVAIPARAQGTPWPLKKLPLGTFLCAAAVIGAFWGAPIIAAYRNWAGI